MSKVLSFRVSDEEARWADEYVAARGLKRQDFLAEGFRSYRADCMGGVPDVPVEAPASSYRQMMESQREKNLRVAREMGWAS